jgi:hypothetical protein
LLFGAAVLSQIDEEVLVVETETLLHPNKEMVEEIKGQVEGVGVV